MSEADTTSRLLSSIKKFGSVTAQKSLKKVIDFAMLFESDKDSNI